MLEILNKTSFFLTRRPYFSGDETTMYYVTVKAKTIRKDAVIAKAPRYFPAFA